MIDVARLVLSLAAEGGVVLIGRGAGFLLPPESTLHVRVVAPLSDRIAYMSQWLRLTREQAAEQVRVHNGAAPSSSGTSFVASPTRFITTTCC